MLSYLIDWSECKFSGPIELGYAYTAKAHSETCHRLPTPTKAFGETNLGRVLYEIHKFIKDDDSAFDGGNPMVFTYADPYASEDSQMDVLKSFIQQFTANRNDAKFDLYPLTRLFYALQKELAVRGRCDDIPNENFSNVFLSRDPYETIGGISCQVNCIISINSCIRNCSMFELFNILVPRRNRCNTSLCAEPCTTLDIFVIWPFLWTFRCSTHSRHTFTHECRFAKIYGHIWFSIFIWIWIGQRIRSKY